MKFGVFVFIVFFAFNFFIYSQTFHYSFHFDDDYAIKANPAIKNLKDLKSIWDFWPTRFITHLSFALNYHFHKLDLFGYHLVNFIIHLANGIIVWRFILLTLATPVMKDKKITSHKELIAFFCGLLFMVHPVQTQGVTYIVQRATSLAAFFYLTSLTLYIKARLTRNKSFLYYTGALAAGFSAMFTKEMGFTLPLAVCLYEVSFFKNRENNISWKLLIPFLSLLLIIPLTLYLTTPPTFEDVERIFKPTREISAGRYLLTQFRVIVTYLRLLFIPINQNLDYAYPVSTTLWHIPTLSSLVLLFLILASGIMLFPKERLLSFAIFFFFLSLSVESSFLPLKDVIFEHRLYLPMLGYSIFLTVTLYYLFRTGHLVKLLVPVLLAIIFAYSISAYHRNKVWKDEFTLWNDVRKKSPKKTRPRIKRGAAYEENMLNRWLKTNQREEPPP